jgi:hypothetical protein
MKFGRRSSLPKRRVTATLDNETSEVPSTDKWRNFVPQKFTFSPNCINLPPGFEMSVVIRPALPEDVLDEGM